MKLPWVEVSGAVCRLLYRRRLVTRYTISLYVVHFNCGVNSGEAQRRGGIDRSTTGGPREVNFGRFLADL